MKTTPPKHRAPSNPPLQRALGVLNDPKPSGEAIAGAVVVGIAAGRLLSNLWMGRHRKHEHGVNPEATPQSPPAQSPSVARRTWDWLGKVTDRALNHATRAAGLEPLQVEATPSTVPATPEVKAAATNLAFAIAGLKDRLETAQATIEAQRTQLKDGSAPVPPEQKQEVTDALERQREALKPLEEAIPSLEKLLRATAPDEEVRPGPVTRQWWPTQLKEVREALSALIAALPKDDARLEPAQAELATFNELSKVTGQTDEQIEETQKNVALGELLKTRLLGVPFGEVELASLDIPTGFSLQELQGAYEKWLKTVHNELPAPLTSVKDVREQLRRDLIVVRTILDDGGASPFLFAFRALGGKDEQAVEKKMPDGQPEALDGQSTYLERVQRALDALEALAPKATAAQKKKLAAAVEPLQKVREELKMLAAGQDAAPDPV